MSVIQVSINIPHQWDRDQIQRVIDAIVRAHNEIADGSPTGRQTRSSAPTGGTWKAGHIIYNSAPSAGGTVGWVCVTSGTPGTWKTFGSIAA